MMCDYNMVDDAERTVLLLSMDKTSAFAGELGIEGFYSNDVCDIARKCVQSSMEDGKDTLGFAIQRQFEKQLGLLTNGRTVHEFLKWQESVLDDLADYNMYWAWIIVLSRLTCHWEDPDLRQSVSTTLPDPGFLKSRVVGYLSEIDGIRIKSGQIENQLESAWDDEIRLVCGEFGCWETLIEVCQARCSRVFWTQLAAEYPSEALDDLLAWAQALAQNEDLPVEQVTLPVALEEDNTRPAVMDHCTRQAM